MYLFVCIRIRMAKSTLARSSWPFMGGAPLSSAGVLATVHHLKSGRADLFYLTDLALDIRVVDLVIGGWIKGRTWIRS